ncbi:MAG: HAD-IIIA family hydrolase [Lachnospiraceae bacterium]
MMDLANFQVVVLMGGLGTRLQEYTEAEPKAMVKIQGIPFFDYQLKLMYQSGFRKFLFLLGYQGEKIQEYYKTGEKLGVTIQYCNDGKDLLGTGGAVRNAFSYLEEKFMLLYADSFMDIDYKETVYRYTRSKKRALMTIFKNNNQLDTSNVWLQDGEIILYDKQNPVKEMEYIDYGIGIYEKEIFLSYAQGIKFDISEIQKKLSLDKQLENQIVIKRFYEIGSPSSLLEFDKYAKKRYFESHPAIFLDRDGVINEIVFNDDIEQFDSPLKTEEVVIMDQVIEALKIIKRLDYYIFIVTNQPAAAKGKTSLATLYDINKKLMSEIEESGIKIDEVYMCPHYDKENTYTKEHFLIKECTCRKPKPGLLYMAKERYNIQWESSYMVGDSYTDILAGKAAGLNTVLIGTLKCDMCKQLQDYRPNRIVNNLLDFARSL